MERFTIKKIIGEGASSTVYKAFDTLNRQNVAIKIFTTTQTRDNERRILQRLKTCNLYHVVEFIESPGDNSFVFELCDSSLISFLNEHELDLKGIKKIMRMILLGICEIHENGIIHRDIKLGNILVKDDTIKICDFGLSCFKEENDYSYCGTRDYLAPEIENMGGGSNHGRYDEKVDVYAAGMIYKILLSRKKNTELESIETETGVKRLIERMTEKDPRRRISAEEGLMDESFEELIVEVPDISELKSYRKMTKYGIVSKYKENGRDVMEMDCNRGINIKIIIDNHQHYKNSLPGTHDKDNLAETHDKDSLPGTHCKKYPIGPQQILLVNGIKMNKRLIPNTILKYFNYLCTYFRILSEQTVKYTETKEGYKFSVTGNNTMILETGSSFIKKRMDKFEGDLSLREAFDNFERKYRDISIETIGMAGIVKRYEFIKDAGWMIKVGMKFTILLNNGRMMEVDVEEMEIKEGSRRMGLKDVSLEILILVRKFFTKFYHTPGIQTQCK